jgi:hypothetical protein
MYISGSVFRINPAKRMWWRMAPSTSLDVFLSFSRKDIKHAEQICQALEANDVKCWMPHCDIDLGQGYLGPVLDAADHCRAVIVIISSNTSDASILVLDRVAGRDVPIIWIKVDQVQPPAEFNKYRGSAIVIDASMLPLELHLQSIAVRMNSLLSHKETTSDRPTNERELEHSTVDRWPEDLTPPHEQRSLPTVGGLRPGDIDDDAVEIALRTASKVLTEISSNARKSTAKPYITEQQRSSFAEGLEGANVSSRLISSTRKRQRSKATFVFLFIGLAVVAFCVGALLHTQIIWLLQVIEGYSAPLSRVR